jgi:hypothetical protein
VTQQILDFPGSAEVLPTLDELAAAERLDAEVAWEALAQAERRLIGLCGRGDAVTPSDRCGEALVRRCSATVTQIARIRTRLAVAQCR